MPVSGEGRAAARRRLAERGSPVGADVRREPGGGRHLTEFSRPQAAGGSCERRGGCGRTEGASQGARGGEAPAPANLELAPLGSLGASCGPAARSPLVTSLVPEMLQVDRSAAGGGRGADVGRALRVRAPGRCRHIPPPAL